MRKKIPGFVENGFWGQMGGRIDQVKRFLRGENLRFWGVAAGKAESVSSGIVVVRKEIIVKCAKPRDCAPKWWTGPAFV